MCSMNLGKPSDFPRFPTWENGGVKPGKVGGPKGPPVPTPRLSQRCTGVPTFPGSPWLRPGQVVTVAITASAEIAGRRAVVDAVSAWDAVLRFEPPTSEGPLVSVPLELVQTSAARVV